MVPVPPASGGYEGTKYLAPGPQGQTVPALDQRARTHASPPSATHALRGLLLSARASSPLQSARFSESLRPRRTSMRSARAGPSSLSHSRCRGSVTVAWIQPSIQAFCAGDSSWVYFGCLLEDAESSVFLAYLWSGAPGFFLHPRLLWHSRQPSGKLGGIDTRRTSSFVGCRDTRNAAHRLPPRPASRPRRCLPRLLRSPTPSFHLVVTATRSHPHRPSLPRPSPATAPASPAHLPVSRGPC